jgi:hypothetical protein
VSTVLPKMNGERMGSGLEANAGESDRVGLW